VTRKGQSRTGSQTDVAGFVLKLAVGKPVSPAILHICLQGIFRFLA
jgi:hypothetical protein